VLQLDAANPGNWGNNLSFEVNHETKDYDTANPDQSLFNLTVSEVDSQSKKVLTTESFPNVSVEADSPRYLPKVLEQRSQLVRVPKDNSGKYIMPSVRPDELTPPTGLESPPSPPPWERVDGDDGGALTDEILEGNQGEKTGLYALEKADLFNLRQNIAGTVGLCLLWMLHLTGQPRARR
jgi:hypothetical protein